MDALEGPPPLPLPDGQDAPVKKAPGRPAISPAQRALNDEKYQQMLEFVNELPEEAREYRFAVYYARNRTDTKADFHPLEKILLSKFKEMNFKDKGALANYLLERYGDGRYFIEPQDAHNHRLDKIPCWVVDAGDPNMDGDDDDEFYDDDDNGRGRRRPMRRRGRDRGEFRDEDLDDPADRRTNIAEMLVTQARVQQSAQAATARSSTDMVSMMMLTTQQAAQARADEERRRDTERAEERRREENRAEDRRREAIEERRREDAKMEALRKEERDREERQRREDAEDRRRDEERRNREHLEAINAANQRLQMIMGGLTTIAPILGRVFERKSDPTQDAILARALQPPPESPMMATLLKSILDKADRQDGAQMIMQQMGESAKFLSQMTAEQMKSVMAMTGDINREMMKKAMDMMLASPQGQTEEGKDMISKVMAALGSASEIVKSFLPPPQAPQQQAQQRRGLPHQQRPGLPAPQQQQRQPAQPAQQPAQPQQQQPQQAAQQPVPQQPATLTPEQQAAVAQAPTGVHGVLGCLCAIQKKAYVGDEQYQHIIGYLLSNVPVDLRVALIENNTPAVLAICKPFTDQDPELNAWVAEPGVIKWIVDYVPSLVPHIISMYGDAAKQRAELDAALAAQDQAMAAAQAAQAAQAGQPPVAPPSPPAADATAAPVSPAPPAAEAAPPSPPAPSQPGQPEEPPPLAVEGATIIPPAPPAPPEVPLTPPRAAAASGGSTSHLSQDDPG